MANRIEGGEIAGDLQITGNLEVGSGNHSEAKFNVSGRRKYDSLQHMRTFEYRQNSGADVASATCLIGTARGTGTILAVKVACDTAPTGGDKAYTVDVKKSTGGGAFASILSSVVTINSSDTSRSVSSGTLSTTTFVADDIFEVVVAASGSTGSQGQGVVVELIIDDVPV